MTIVEFLLGADELPVYRAVEDPEIRVLEALLGRDFRFELVDGEPVDALLFDVLARVSIRPDFYFTPPPDAVLLGTFQLRDRPGGRPERRRRAPARTPVRPRIH